MGIYHSGLRMARASGFSTAATSNALSFPAELSLPSVRRQWERAARGIAQTIFFLPHKLMGRDCIGSQPEAEHRSLSPAWIRRALRPGITALRFCRMVAIS